MPCNICGEFCGGYVPICDKCNGERKMTTLKEYKAMMEGATDAVAFVCRTLGWLEVVPPYGDKVDRTKECDKAIIECGKIRDALNKQADLIRVIELADELLNDINDCPTFVDQATVPKNGVEVNPQQVVLNMSISLIKYRAIEQTLSEIRKLKGE